MRSVVDLPQPDGPTSTTNSSCGDLEVDAMHHLQRAVALDELFRGETVAIGSSLSPPPKVSPAIRCFWTMKVRTSAGMMISTAMALMPRQSTVNWAV